MIVLSVVVFAAIGILMPIIKLYATDARALNMSETQFGSITAAVAAVLGVLALPFGRLGDRLGKMVSVCYGLVLCTAAMWMIAIVKSVWVMTGAAAVLGVGFELAFPAWMAVVSLASPAGRQGQIMGAVGLAQGVGALLGALIAPVIYTSDALSLPRLGVNHINLPFWLCAVLLSISTVMTFTWISGTRCAQSGGRLINGRERAAIKGLAAAGLVAVAGWVAYRYTTPLPPDRVAWLWEQKVVRQDFGKARRYTLPSFEEAGGNGSRAAAVVYGHWVRSDRGSSAPTRVTYTDQGRRAEVELTFVFPAPGMARRELIVLVKQSSGEWRIAERRSLGD
jgi:MFS family permease